MRIRASNRALTTGGDQRQPGQGQRQDHLHQKARRSSPAPARRRNAGEDERTARVRAFRGARLAVTTSSHRSPTAAPLRVRASFLCAVTYCAQTGVFYCTQSRVNAMSRVMGSLRTPATGRTGRGLHKSSTPCRAGAARPRDDHAAGARTLATTAAPGRGPCMREWPGRRTGGRPAQARIQLSRGRSSRPCARDVRHRRPACRGRRGEDEKGLGQPRDSRGGAWCRSGAAGKHAQRRWGASRAAEKAQGRGDSAHDPPRPRRAGADSPYRTLHRL